MSNVYVYKILWKLLAAALSRLTGPGVGGGDVDRHAEHGAAPHAVRVHGQVGVGEHPGQVVRPAREPHRRQDRQVLR